MTPRRHPRIDPHITSGPHMARLVCPLEADYPLVIEYELDDATLARLLAELAEEMARRLNRQRATST